MSDVKELSKLALDADIRERLTTARMVGRDALSTDALMKQPMSSLMQLSAERSEALLWFAKALQQARDELLKERIQVQTLQSLTAATAAQLQQHQLAAHDDAAADSTESNDTQPPVAPAPAVAALASSSKAKKKVRRVTEITPAAGGGAVAAGGAHGANAHGGLSKSTPAAANNNNNNGSWLADSLPTQLPFPINGCLVDRPEQVLSDFDDAIHSKQFYDWCKQSLTNENLEFYLCVELYRTLPPPARAVKAAEILRHFIQEGATAQINIDHGVRTALEAALPPALIALVEKMTADAIAEAKREAERENEEVGFLDFLHEEPPPKGKEPTPAEAKKADKAAAAKAKKDDAAARAPASPAPTPVAVAPSSPAPVLDPMLQNIPVGLFDEAQARVFELMERDAWVRFSVDANKKLKMSAPLKMSSKGELIVPTKEAPAAKPLKPIVQVKRDRATGKIVVIRRGE
jgi:hypothetical protein